MKILKIILPLTLLGVYRVSGSFFKALINVALPTPYPYRKNGHTALNNLPMILYHQIDKTYY
tara:strand:+ start:2875 stop:3060 length:186 start_codon:yes stop_codon:yes gene_type:complete